MNKIYFKLNQEMAIIGYVIGYVFSPLLFVISIKNKSYFICFIIILIVFILTLNLIIFKINGFKYDDKKIRIISKYKIRTFEFSNIDRIDVEFKKRETNYYVFAKVYLYNKNSPVYFEWTSVSSRYFSYKYDVDDTNIEDFCSKLSYVNKVNVTIDR